MMVCGFKQRVLAAVVPSVVAVGQRIHWESRLLHELAAVLWSLETNANEGACFLLVCNVLYSGLA